MEIDKASHLTSSEEEINLTEFELQLWHAHHSFCRWQEECEKTSNPEELAVDDIVVLHIIRLKDRPKSIAEIGRVLDHDNVFGINYSITKLLKLKLIQKIEQPSRKQYFYTVTEKGKKNTDAYTAARRKILINEFIKGAKDLNLPEITKGLMKLKTLYEEAIKFASFYQEPERSSEIKPETKK